VFAFGLAAAAVGLFETVTVYVSQTQTDSALTAPFWLLTQTAIVFVYFFGMGAMATLAVAIVRTGVVASWAGWLCAVVTLLLAIASLAACGGTGAMGLLGLAQVLVGFLPSAITLLILSILLLQPKLVLVLRGRSGRRTCNSVGCNVENGCDARRHVAHEARPAPRS
jgi:hypothetical protein